VARRLDKIKPGFESRPLPIARRRVAQWHEILNLANSLFGEESGDEHIRVGKVELSRPGGIAVSSAKKPPRLASRRDPKTLGESKAGQQTNRWSR
jgi:hypothetical protein